LVGVDVAGECVGDVVGLVVGDDVIGEREVDAVGDVVGDDVVGLVVGDVVGDCVGDVVGLVVGDVVGDWVVGVMVGDDVIGDCVGADAASFTTAIQNWPLRVGGVPYARRSPPCTVVTVLADTDPVTVSTHDTSNVVPTEAWRRSIVVDPSTADEW